eukprot:2117522-Prymnesium_polylepis.1
MNMCMCMYVHRTCACLARAAASGLPVRAARALRGTRTGAQRSRQLDPPDTLELCPHAKLLLA